MFGVPAPIRRMQGGAHLGDNWSVSSPAREIDIVCKGCGGQFAAMFYRPSINISTEVWTKDEIRTSTTAKCPDCGVVVQLTALIVDGGEFRLLNGAGEDST